jgi:hypothetical protein
VPTAFRLLNSYAAEGALSNNLVALRVFFATETRTVRASFRAIALSKLRLLLSNPREYLGKRSAEANRKRKARALSEKELNAMLDAAPSTAGGSQDGEAQGQLWR